MSTFLITGCSRGIGLALTKRLLTYPASTVGLVFATSRGPSASAELASVISSSDGRVQYVQLDTTLPDGIKAAAEHVAKVRGSKGIDVLVNNAGVSDHTRDGAVEHLTPEEFNRVFDTNVMAPHRTIAAFLPLLRRGQDKKIINISSTVGSTTYNQQGVYQQVPTPAYKITKAALNALTVQYHAQLHTSEGFTVKSVNPGWLKTDLGGAWAPLAVDTGAEKVVDIIINEGRESSGRFRNVDVDGLKENDTVVYDGLDSPF